jgi:hypothetical protein
MFPAGHTDPSIPTARATVAAVAAASPVTMTVRTPSDWSSASNARESPRAGSPNAISPMNASLRGGPHATPKVRYPALARASSSAVTSGLIGAIAATAAGAPLITRTSVPRRSIATASAVLTAGSNGLKRSSVIGAPNALLRCAVVRIAVSIGSCPSAELASAARARTSSSL